MSQHQHPRDEVEIQDNAINHIFHDSEKALRIVGIAVMIFVAFNDASLCVMARTMKDIHFSLLQFWFGTAGSIIIIIYLIIDSIALGSWPRFLYYDSEQYMHIIVTGFLSALNLTCLTIAF